MNDSSNDKIEKAIEAMIANPEKIGSVKIGAGDTYFHFKYKDKFKWGIFALGEDIVLVYYPPQEGATPVTYDSSIGGSEKRASLFRALYALVKDKIYGLDSMLDEIASDLKQKLD